MAGVRDEGYAIVEDVMRQRQYFDVILRRANGRWKVSTGINGLFTLLPPP